MKLALLLMLVCVPPVQTAEPPLFTTTPSVASILAVRAEIAALVKKEAAMVAEFNKELAKLGIKPVESLGFGKGPKGDKGDRGPKGDKGDPGKDASPAPPNPPPPDTWPASNLYILIVAETADATPSHAQLFASADLAERIKVKGHKWRIADKDARDKDGNVPADLRAWFKLAEGKPLPQLFIVDPTGKTRFEGPLPTSAAKLLELLGKVGG